MKRYIWIGLVIVLLAGVANAAVVDPKLVAANNDFGVRLLRKLTAAERGKNVFISPASISLALSMTYNGADGSTKDAMAKTLGYQGLSLGQINSANAALLAGFAKPGDGVQLEIANSLWAKEGEPFYPDFVARNKQFYSAQITTLPFDSKAVGKINSWASKKTHGKIPEIIDSIDADEKLFLINAVYFESEWANQFDSRWTGKKPFTLSSGKKETVPMMNQTIEGLSYIKMPNASAINLPYKGSRFGLWIFLPNTKTGLSALVRNLDAKSLNKWIASSKKREVDLYLPKFKLEYATAGGIKTALSNMGMGIAFSGEHANFLKMCPPRPNTYISLMIHKTYLELDEVGTKAAALTLVAVAGGIEIPPPPPPVIFKVDHPFLCLIRDNKTKAILFIGAVENP